MRSPFFKKVPVNLPLLSDKIHETMKSQSESKMQIQHNFYQVFNFVTSPHLQIKVIQVWLQQIRSDWPWGIWLHHRNLHFMWKFIWKFWEVIHLIQWKVMIHIVAVMLLHLGNHFAISDCLLLNQWLTIWSFNYFGEASKLPTSPAVWLDGTLGAGNSARCRRPLTFSMSQWVAVFGLGFLSLHFVIQLDYHLWIG